MSKLVYSMYYVMILYVNLTIWLPVPTARTTEWTGTATFTDFRAKCTWHQTLLHHMVCNHRISDLNLTSYIIQENVYRMKGIAKWKFKVV